MLPKSCRTMRPTSNKCMPKKSDDLATVSDSAPGRGVTVLRLGVEPVYRAAIFAGSMMLSSQIAATVSSVM